MRSRTLKRRYRRKISRRCSLTGWVRRNGLKSPVAKNTTKPIRQTISHTIISSTRSRRSNLKIKISARQGTPSAQEIYRLDKDARVETLVVRSADFHSAENLNKTIETVIIDGGTFLREGFKKDRKRELAPSSPICPTRRAEAGLLHLEARSVGVCSGTRTSPAGLALIKTPSSILPALSCIPEHQTNAIMDGDRSCSAGTLTTACSVPSSMETETACCWTIRRSLPLTVRSAT